MTPEELVAIKEHIAPFRGCPDCRVADLVGEVERLQKTLAALDDTPHHVLDVRADGWTLKHPLSCRPRLFDCPVNEACQGFDGPPAAIGRYVVELDGDGELVIGEEVRADG